MVCSRRADAAPPGDRGSARLPRRGRWALRRRSLLRRESLQHPLERRQPLPEPLHRDGLLRDDPRDALHIDEARIEPCEARPRRTPSVPADAPLPLYGAHLGGPCRITCSTAHASTSAVDFSRRRSRPSSEASTGHFRPVPLRPPDPTASAAPSAGSRSWFVRRGIRLGPTLSNSPGHSLACTIRSINPSREPGRSERQSRQPDSDPRHL